MALFNADSYQEVSIDWLAVTLKYDNHGELEQQCCLTKDHGTECAMETLRTLSINWTRPDEITGEKNTIGATGYQIFQRVRITGFLTVQLHRYFSRYVRDTLRRFRAKVGLMASSERAGLGH